MHQRDIMLKGGYLTVSESARRIGVNPSTIYRLISDGKVETGRAGQNLFIKASSLAALYKEAPPIFDRIMEGIDKGNGAPRK